MRRLLPILCMLALSTCTHEEVEIVDLDQYGPSNSGFTVLKEFDSDISDISSINTYGFDEGTKATATNLINAVSGILSSAMTTTVHQVVGTYTSIDPKGNPVTVSGKIFYPKQGPIKNMMVVSHYTIGSNAECPSESFSFEGVYAALGYAVVIADYLGYGVSANIVHPYLHSDTCASNVIDMALVARPFLAERGLTPQSDDIILLGYSQGGATTMHVQRLLETNPKYKGKFKIKKNYAGAGPYNIARTYDYCIKLDYTGIPCAVPMIIQGLSGTMTVPIEMSYFFQEPLLSHYDEWLNSKNYTVAQVSDLIGSHYLSQILTENARDKSKAETARFYKELTANSIPVDFLPQAPLFMFHSEDDQTVPFINSQLLQRQIVSLKEWNGNPGYPVEYDFGHYGTHQQGALKFILKVATLLD